LREGLKKHLSPLPAVPNLDEEEATERIEHLVVQKGTPGKKGA